MVRDGRRPADIRLAIMPNLGRRLAATALRRQDACGWATGDRVYGQDPALRAEPAHGRLGCVLAVAKDHGLARAYLVDLRLAR